MQQPIKMSSHVSKQCPEIFNVELYNSLPTVGVADRILNQLDDREAFFKEIGTLIGEFDLEDHIGVCLLHNHNLVTNGHFMLEIFDKSSYSTPALVMQHIERAGETQQHVPVVFKVEAGNELVGLEYSTVELAKGNYEKLFQQSSEFLPRFCAVVTRFGYQNILGLSVLRVDALDREVGDILLERTDDQRIANIVTADKERPTKDARYIETIWHFEKTTQANNPSREMATTCLTECKYALKCANKCIFEEGGKHEGIHDNIEYHSEELHNKTS